MQTKVDILITTHYMTP